MHVLPAATAVWVLFGSLMTARPPPDSTSSPPTSSTDAARAYGWPIRGRVLRGFEPAASPYGPGHRGIDIEAEAGTPVRSAERGVVAYAGTIGGERFISILHPDGIRTTYSWLSRLEAREGDVVVRGEVIGRSGSGHPGSKIPHLHLGARWGEVYLDPLTLLEPVSLVGIVRLAPLGAWARSPP